MRSIINIEAILTTAAHAEQSVINLLYVLGVAPYYIDDHRQVRTVVNPKHSLLISNGKTFRVCPVGEKINGCWAFSLNQLYMKDEEIHLSVLSTSTFHVNSDCSIEEAVDIYNEQVDANPFAEWKVISLIRM